MSALQLVTRERTDWLPPVTAPYTAPYETSGWEPTFRMYDQLWAPVMPRLQYTFVHVGLLEKAWFDAFTNGVTTVPRIFVLTCEGPDAPAETAAQKMVSELRTLSGLTNEEIAPLMGVSRRSLQSWIAGESISARKESRLRAVLDAVRQLAAASAVGTRERLLSRLPHSVSAYDLLAEERYEAAIDLAIGRRRVQAPKSAPPESLEAQLDRIEDNIAPAPRLNRKLSGSLKR